jgi:next-to-BRCA1 protein 1
MAMKMAAKQFKQGFKPWKMFKGSKGCKARMVPPQGPLFSEEQVSFIRNLVREEAGLAKPVHTRFTCDGCGVHPIEGVRYNCTVCRDFDFCETCEAKTEHAHPFIKHKTAVAPRCFRAAPQEVVVDLDLGNVLPFVPEKLQQVVNKFHKQLSKKFKPNAQGLKGRPQAHLTLAKFTEVLPATEYVKTWVLINKGKVAWPVGTKLVHMRGTVEALNVVELPPLSPGETAEVSVNVRTPSSSGKAKGVWRFETPDGQVFGRAKCMVMVTGSIPTAEVPEADEAAVSHLASMGFPVDQAREVLLVAKNDVNLAVSMLVKQ